MSFWYDHRYEKDWTNNEWTKMKDNAWELEKGAYDMIHRNVGPSGVRAPAQRSGQ
jgi:hypothetical protein